MIGQEPNLVVRIKADTASDPLKARMLPDVVRRTNVRPTTITQWKSGRIDVLQYPGSAPQRSIT
jgi:hypothetical protein